MSSDLTAAVEALAESILGHYGVVGVADDRSGFQRILVMVEGDLAPATAHVPRSYRGFGVQIVSSAGHELHIVARGPKASMDALMGRMREEYQQARSASAAYPDGPRDAAYFEGTPKESPMTTMMIYAPCAACAEARSAGRLAEALACHACGGKGICRTRESWVCNKCGGCLCPGDEKDMNGEVPHGLVDARVQGGYSSPYLSDCTNYKFSLCEKCLRELFDGCAVKPVLTEYMLGVLGGDDVDRGEVYEEEAAERRAMDERQAASDARFFALYESEQCAAELRDENDNPTDDYCEQPGLGRLLYESDWKYNRRWLCAVHIRDAFVARDATLHLRGNKLLTWLQRAALGLETIARLQAHHHRPSYEYDFASANIAISTMFPMLLRPSMTEFIATEMSCAACHVSEGETVTLGAESVWYDARVPMAFPPNKGWLASVANSWLAWGKLQRYDNAVAAAILGHTSESLWGERGSGH